MTFTARKYKDIFEEMRAMSDAVTDFEVGSVARTMYESFSYELALLYEKMHLVYLSAYVDTARGNQLDQVVAVLGIQRSQPDFAEGEVSFIRDSAGQELLIPNGTLVATEETATGEKKVFQTIREATLGATKTEIAVQIRAVERGEEMETAAETIVVMPRPVPGIKNVVNNAPIRLVGKRRESDLELRERAKNTLISSGKANILSIENALLSLSGIRDVRVR
ncbi:MAG: baseplate J/gp47 family protein [Bacteroidota bacterium]